MIKRILQKSVFSALQSFASAAGRQKINAANRCLAEGQRGQAIDILDSIKRNSSFYGEAQCRLAEVSAGQNDLDRAITHYSNALASHAQRAHAHLGLAAVYLHKGDTDQAISHIRETETLTITDAADLFRLGSLYRSINEIENAQKTFLGVVELAPESEEYLLKVAEALLDTKMKEKLAIRALAINRHSTKALFLLGVARYYENPEKAEKPLLHAQKRDINNQQTARWLAYSYHGQGRIEKCVEILRSVVKRKNNPIDHSALIFAMNYLQEITKKKIYEESRSFASAVETSLAIRSLAEDKPEDMEKRLRVGYVSGDFRRHVVAELFLPILLHHDRKHFDIYCYYNNVFFDDVTERIKQNSNFRVIEGVSNEKVVDIVLGDDIDILVDLSGHTANNRLPVFSKKPAPIQMSGIGYPETTGLFSIDYRISQIFMEPLSLCEKYSSEKPVYLPAPGIAFAEPACCCSSPLPALRNGYITFASFSRCNKVGDNMIPIWAEILKHVPDSQLLLNVPSKNATRVKADLCRRFCDLGVTNERLSFYESMPFAEFLRFYARADIALDTFPYNSMTTLFYALCMGIPFVTLPGDTALSRGGGMLLSSVGLNKLICETSQQYVQAAVQLAGNYDELADLRANLRDYLHTSGLADMQTYTRNLEKAYREVWRRWCLRVPPSPLWVE